MLRIFRSVSAAKRGSVGKGDGSIPVPRISKRQRATTRGNAKKQRQQQQRGQQLRSAEATLATQVLHSPS